MSTRHRNINYVVNVDTNTCKVIHELYYRFNDGSASLGPKSTPADPKSHHQWKPKFIHLITFGGPLKAR
jgi:hypothetical protein